MTELPVLSYRRMVESDLDAVVAVEAGSQAFPWSRLSFAASLAAGHDAEMACSDAGLVGYSVTMPVVDEVHLLNLTVVPECRRQGRGAQMLRHLLDRAKAATAVRMLLEVRASNGPALALYRKLGFADIGRRHNYYSQGEDAVVMAKDV